MRRIRRCVAMAVSLAALVMTTVGVGGVQARFHDRDCSDFNTQAAAQHFYIKHGGPKKDRHRLDADHDGLACEDLP